MSFDIQMNIRNTNQLSWASLPAGISSAEKENPHCDCETKYGWFLMRTIFFLVVVLFQDFAILVYNGFWFVLVVDDLPNNKWQS